MSSQITILKHSTNYQTKVWKADGVIVPSANGKHFTLQTVDVSSLDGLSRELTKLEKDPYSSVIRGKYIGDEEASKIDPEYKEGLVRRILELHKDKPLPYLMIDVDGFEPEFDDPIKSPVKSIKDYIESNLPVCFHNCSFHWQLSSSAGKKGSEETLKSHIWFWLKNPYTSYKLKNWSESINLECDKSLFNPVQIHFTANPVFEDGVEDPIPIRSGLERLESDEVDLVIDEDIISSLTITTPTRLQVRQETLSNDPVAVHLEENKYVKSYRPDGGLNIICPFKDGHTIKSSETSTVYYPPHTGGFKYGGFKCMHEHCSNMSRKDLLEKLELEEVREFYPQDHTGMAESLLESNFKIGSQHTLIRNMGNWYHYKTTCYRKREDDAIRSEIRRFLDGSMKIKDDKLIPFHPTLTQICGVMDALVSFTLIESGLPPMWLDECEDEEPTNYVSFKNGILHIPSGKFLPHTPSFFTLNSLPFDYVEEGTPELWIGFLKEVFQNDQDTIDTLQEIFGYTITPTTFMQKMFMLLGPKRSGKGTIARVLTSMLGKQNVCGSNLNSLATNFGLQPLQDKLLAIFPDVRISGQSDIKTIIGNLLSISGEDDITIDRKYKDQWNGKLTSRIFIISNELPQLVDSNDALGSRFIYLSTQKSFYGKEDVNLTQKLLKELPQIFLWSLEGRKRLLDRGYFIQPTSSQNLLDDYRKLSNPLLSFIEEECKLGDYYIEKTQLYDQYCHWCRDNGYKHPKTMSVFSRDLSSTDSSIKSCRKMSNGDRVYFFSGIQISKKEDAFDS